MRFTDARSAGLALASKLEAYDGREDVVVLALARGGVAVGLEVSKRLGLPLDILLLSRLLVPRGHENPLCAVSVAGALFLDEEIKSRAEADPVLQQFVAGALDELGATVRACRGERPAAQLAGKTVLLVDNGVRTGSTMRVALRALSASRPARAVAAVPVAAPDARASVEAGADDFVSVASPEPFGHVGLWYADFKRSSDEEIRAMLEESARV